ncbi:MAG: FAD-dependent oxidoreductase [Planctomycetales bacterium]|nr:FAD-dependent oxidoreductase [Planctomycetales bacterium]
MLTVIVGWLFTRGRQPLVGVGPLSACVLLIALTGVRGHGDVLVEAESFAEYGGWSLDTQFVETMGSPYLLAHGLGNPVADASTTVRFREKGEYHVYVRTKDWVAPWNAPGTPGRFQLLINGEPLPVTFGTSGDEWGWQSGGVISVDQNEITLSLHDLTGFEGRCDAIYFSQDAQSPTNDAAILPRWRRQLLGLADEPIVKDYDLVVVGGGYSGMGAAISAARMGCNVALIQNRSVLGGNGSSEVRVWSMGLIRRGRFPRIGEIVEEFCDHATKSPGNFEEFEDAKKERIVRSEKNIDLFLNHHAYEVAAADGRIESVSAFNVKSSERIRFRAPLFADCTGHGTIGFLARADWEMSPQDRMGMSNMWAWAEGGNEKAFPRTPWALDLTMDDFPYPRDHHGQWFWEGGFDKDPIKQAELIRDWNLRAVFGAFNAMKNGDGAAQHGSAYLTWVAYVGGTRESRRLMGDVLLTQDDIVNKKQFPDGCVPSTWSIDLHYPKKQFAEAYPDNPFISIAVHDRRIDRDYGYPVPYRCFYSRNIANLFMAGRCISVTHEALGTTRVMKTCGMMGEVVGRAASICIRHECLPRDVYERHWEEMEELLQLPGAAYRETVEGDVTIPESAMKLAGPHGPVSGRDPEELEGLVVDDAAAKKVGNWTAGDGLKGYVGSGYQYASAGSDATMTFTLRVEKSGVHEVRLAYLPHENRGTNVPVTVSWSGLERHIEVNMRQPPPIVSGFISLGTYELTAANSVSVTLSAAESDGFVHADAVQVIRVE